MGLMTEEYIDTGSFILFARPSFAQGASSLIDVGSTQLEYNYSKTEQEADIHAIASDWRVVGRDLFRAIGSVAPVDKNAGSELVPR